MSFFTSICLLKDQLLVRGYDSLGDQISYKTSGDDMKLKLYGVDVNGESKFKTLAGQKLKEISFDTISEFQEFKRDFGRKLDLHGDFPIPNQYITQNKLADEPDVSKIRVGTFDIETESIHGFPNVIDPIEQLIVISCHSSRTNILHCFVLGEHGKNIQLTDIEVKMVNCQSERELIFRFLDYWKEEKFDIVSGWNCIPVSESIWLKDRIITINDVEMNQKLFDSEVCEIFPKSVKPISTITLKNGHQVLSSKDHIFPIYILPKNKYIDPNNEKLIQKDIKVEEINLLLSENNIYLRQELPQNISEPLTYRKFIVENLDHLLEKGFNIFVRDKELIEKVKKYPLEFYKIKKLEHWTIEKITELFSRNEVLTFIERSKTIQIYSPQINKSSMIINLDEEIPLNDLWLIGMWYTDGTQSYKTEFSICNKNEEIAIESNKILNKFRKNDKTNIKRSIHDECFYVGTGLSNVWFLKIFIYNHVKSCSKKKIDKLLLSQLSKTQFTAFMSGCIDGDGWVNEQGRISICNYNDDIKHFAELLNWNGIFTTIYGNNNRLTFCNDLFNQFIIHPKKKLNSINSKNDTFIRNTKSKKLNWIIKDNYALVQISKIDLDDNTETTMMDISTNTGYFVTRGIKSHNCSGFDSVFLYHRIKKVLSKNEANKLSFWNHVLVKTSEKNNKLTHSVDFYGTTILDYLELYKKFVQEKRESYKLDNIAEYELNENKLEYSEFDSIQEFWEKDPEKFVLYNIQDTMLVVRLNQKLKLLHLAFTFSYIAKQNYSDVFSPIRTWDSLCYNYLYEKNIAVPPSSHTGKSESFAGAYVKESQPGLFKDVVSLDVNSLYPSCIRMLNISPETLVQKIIDPSIQDHQLVEQLKTGELKNYSKHKENDYTLSANGQFFRKDKKGMFPEIMENLIKKRKEANSELVKMKQELEEVNKLLEE